MLKVIKDHLDKLARDPDDPFVRSIRKISGPRNAVRVADPLRRLVLSIPEMVQTIRINLKEAKFHSSLKRLQMFALDYLLNPVDFLPETSLGLFGYVDDGYLIGNIYLKTMMVRGQKRTIKTHNDSPKVKDVESWVELVRSLLPRETNRIDRLIKDLEFKKPLKGSL